MSIVFPQSASVLFRQTTGLWYNGNNAPGSGSDGQLSWDNMDSNFYSLQTTDQNIINLSKGAAYTGSSNVFTEPQQFTSNVEINGNLTGSIARFGNQVFSEYPGVGFVGTASWAVNVVGGGGGGVGTLQQVTTLGNTTNLGIDITSGNLTIKGLNVSSSIATLNRWTGSNTSQFAGTSSYATIANFASSSITSSYTYTASWAENSINYNPEVRFQANILGPTPESYFLLNQNLPMEVIDFLPPIENSKVITFASAFSQSLDYSKITINPMGIHCYFPTGQDVTTPTILSTLVPTNNKSFQMVWVNQPNPPTYPFPGWYYVDNYTEGTASYSVSASFSQTASYLNPLNQTVSLVGNLDIIGDINATNLNVINITSSNEYLTGSTKFGDEQTDKHQFTGSVNITGSLISPNITGSLFGTASWANNSLTASYISNNNLGVLTANSLVDQTLPVSNQSTMSYDNPLIQDKVSITGIGNNKILFEQDGIYNIQFSAQVVSSNNDTVYIWFAHNGSDISDSNSSISLRSNEPKIAAWNYIDNFATNDTFEIRWAAGNTNTRLEYDPTPTYGPAIPSVIVTVNQIK